MASAHMIRIAATRTAISLLLSAVAVYPVFGDVVYVDDAAGSGGNGASWLTAFNNLQSALNVAETGDQIWVADGVYFPTAALDPNEPRTETFSLISGVAIYGGFRGRDELDPNNIFTGETSLTQRDARVHRTSIPSGATAE